MFKIFKFSKLCGILNFLKTPKSEVFFTPTLEFEAAVLKSEAEPESLI